MKRHGFLATAIGVVAFLFSAPLLAQQQSVNETTAEQAADFTLTDSHGNVHNLSDYRGKFVVLEWLNHDCPFVKKHYNSGNMQELQQTYTDQGVVWLSIISSAPGKQGHCSPDQANELVDENEATPTAVLLDESGDVGRLYGAKTTPHMFVIDPNGVKIYEGAIDDTRSTDVDDVEGAVNYVAQALSQAMAGEQVSVSRTQPYGCSVKY